MHRFFKPKSRAFYYPGQEISLPGRSDLSLKSGYAPLSDERGRLATVAAGFVVAFGILSGQMVNVSSFSPTVDVAKNTPKIVSLDLKMARADITDRNGVLLATSLPSVDLYADLDKIKNPENVAAGVAQTLPDLKYKDVLAKLKSKRSFVYLKRRLTPTEQYEINRLGFPALNFQNNEIRVYPQGNLFSHLIGKTDIDNKGISGLEKSFNTRLKTQKENLRLTLDVGVQNAVRTVLKKALDDYGADGASAILMHAKTGDVVAMVSLPDFDPNLPLAPNQTSQFNTASLGVYELGSVMKLFNTAIGIETKKVKLSDTFDARNPIILANHTITEEKNLRRVLTTPEVLIYSSNIGSAQIAMRVGSDKQKEYLKKFGFLNPLSVDIPERGQPIYPLKWRESNVVTISYGYGLSVTPLHLAAAASALVNGGTYRTPSFVVDTREENEKNAVRVISKKTSDAIRVMMRMVVLQGTGRNANVAGYEVGGKTGSARKLSGGQYVEGKVRTSFLSAFPMDDPEYVLMVMLDTPRKPTGKTNAAYNAVPVSNRIISAVAPQLGVMPRPYESTQVAPYVRTVLAEK